MKISFEGLTVDCDEAFVERLKRMLGADAAFSALWDIGQEVFRPARKHGYPDQETQQLLDLCNTLETSEGYGAGSELVSLLERKFYEILRGGGVELD